MWAFPQPVRWVEPGEYPVREHGVFQGTLIVREVLPFADADNTPHACRWAGQRAIVTLTTTELIWLGLPVRT